MNTVDVWAQVPNERMAASSWLAPLLRWTDQTAEPLVSTVEKTLESMDQANVDISLLSAWQGPQGVLISNEEVSKQIDLAPHRFRGLATVDLAKPVEAVRTIYQWVDGKKFVGVRVVPWLWDLPPNHRFYYPIYAACVDLGVPFCTQIGHAGPLMRSEPCRPIPYLEDVLLDFPELVIVGGHLGFPWVEELISLSIKFPNFHVDTSAYSLHRLPENFISFMKGIGSTRVMFGTNWPMLSATQCLAGLTSLGLSDQQEKAFLTDNARRVFKL